MNENITFDRANLTLTCTSTGGPATTVDWTRDNQLLQFNVSPFSHVQVVSDLVMGTYLNILKASALSDLVGNFSCVVANRKGMSNTASILLGGM